MAGTFTTRQSGRKGNAILALGGADVLCTRPLAVSAGVYLNGYALQEVNKVNFGAEKGPFVRASEA
jgi:hypothetical protein